MKSSKTAALRETLTSLACPPLIKVAHKMSVPGNNQSLLPVFIKFLSRAGRSIIANLLYLADRISVNLADRISVQVSIAQPLSAD